MTADISSRRSVGCYAVVPGFVLFPLLRFIVVSLDSYVVPVACSLAFSRSSKVQSKLCFTQDK